MFTAMLHSNERGEAGLGLAFNDSAQHGENSAFLIVV
jgi:hypothetical protein